MRPALDLVRVKALQHFTITTGYGQFHGDPANPQARHVMVPADKVAALVNEGRAERAEPEAAPAAKAARSPKGRTGGRAGARKRAPARKPKAAPAVAETGSDASDGAPVD